MISPARVPGTGASNIASCNCGSKRSPTSGEMTSIPCFLNTLVSSRIVSSTPSIKADAAARCSSPAASSARFMLSNTGNMSRASFDPPYCSASRRALSDLLRAFSVSASARMNLSLKLSRSARSASISASSSEISSISSASASASASLMSSRKSFSFGSAIPQPLVPVGYQFPNQLRCVVHNRNNPSIVQTCRSNDPNSTDNLSIRVHIGRDHQRGTRK